MSDFNGKTVIVSGGAEGIGFSIAQSMGREGMNVVLGDIDEYQLEVAKNNLESEGIEVLIQKMDVTKAEQWLALGQSAVARFGKVHMLVNNAGVSSRPGAIENTSHSDWDWVIDVNLKGVLYGSDAIVPLIKQHTEGGWIINVASMAGMVGVPFAGAYTATKSAVVAMSESWRAELASHDIQVSVLCPALVKTRMHLSARNRQEHHKDISDSIKKQSDEAHEKVKNPAVALVENGIPAELVGQRVVEAVSQGELYIFTHPDQRSVAQKRFQEIDAAFERSAASPIVGDVKQEGMDVFDI